MLTGTKVYRLRIYLDERAMQIFDSLFNQGNPLRIRMDQGMSPETGLNMAHSLHPTLNNQPWAPPPNIIHVE